MPIDILLTTYFRKDFTKQVIDHIIERTKTPFQFIVVDNGSTDGTREMLKEYEKAHPSLFKRVILLNENKGLERAKMIGLEYVESDLFVNTDNDVLCPLLEPDWLAQLIELMTNHPQYAAISMRPQILVGVGPIFAGARDTVVENNVAGGSLRIMNTGLVKLVGGWRDIFDSRSEEWHICTKLREVGYKVGYARDLFCYHLFGDNENWGYPDDVKHYHNPHMKAYAKDSQYDPITMMPKIKNNE